MSDLLGVDEGIHQWQGTMKYVQHEVDLIRLAVEMERWDDAAMLTKAMVKYLEQVAIWVEGFLPAELRPAARQNTHDLIMAMRRQLRTIILHAPSQEEIPRLEIVSEPIPVDDDTPRWVPVVAWLIILLAIYAVGYLSIQLTGAVT